MLSQKNMKSKLILLLIGVLALHACKKPDEQPKEVKFVLTETLSKGKELAAAKLSTVQAELMLTGKVTFNEDKVARVFPLAGGFVKELFVELGDHVNKGQVMAIIRSPEIAGFAREGVA